MLKKELVQADDSVAIETGIRKFIEWIRFGKLEVKLYRDQNIHAKVYTKTPEGDEKQTKSELKYLRQILAVKEDQPELFARILGLPRKARSTRDHAPELPSAEHPESHPLELRPAVITYFRQGRLDKFFRSHAATDRAEELDFFTTAETLETTVAEKRSEIDPEQFYPLLDKNKTGFTSATTASVETLLPSTASGSGNESIILKRLRAQDVRTCDVFSKEDRHFLVAVPQKREKDDATAPRELILSSYLP